MQALNVCLNVNPPEYLPHRLLF